MYHCKSCIPKVDAKTDAVDYEVTGYSYDTLSLGYTAIRLRSPLVKMFGDASYSIWNENLYSH
jgi:hypothetical protein